MTTAEVERFGEELGFDALGVARAEAYVETERHIRRAPRARAVRGHEVHDGATGGVVPSRVAPARCAQRHLGCACYWLPEEPLEPGEGGSRATRGHDAYAELREPLDELGRRLGGAYRVLVDANQHVDREAAARSGVGFYGKNTMLITRRHGSWVVLGTLVTDVELEPTPPLDADCGSCRLCIDACPTGALDEPGTLDATKCLSYWTQAPAPIPEPYRAELGAQVYGCDICQDVCPWNRGVEKRRAGDWPRARRGHVDLVEWLEADGARGGRPVTTGSTCRETIRAGCGAMRSSRSETPGRPEHLPLLERFAAGDDDAARRARRVGARSSAGARVRSSSDRPLEWWIAIVRLIAVPFAVLQVALTSGYPPDDARDLAWALAVVFVIGAVALYVTGRRASDAPVPARRARSSTSGSSRRSRFSTRSSLGRRRGSCCTSRSSPARPASGWKVVS